MRVKWEHTQHMSPAMARTQTARSEDESTKMRQPRLPSIIYMDEAERNIVIRSVILICETLTNHDILLAITEFSNCLINRSPSFFQGSDLPFFTRERCFNYAWAEHLQQNTFRRYHAWALFAGRYFQVTCWARPMKRKKKMHRMIKNIGSLSSLT